MTQDPRIAGSRAAFAQRFPIIAAALDQPETGVSTVLVEAGDAVDLVVGEQRLYGRNARAFAAEQIDRYMDNPLRLFMLRPTSAGLVSPISIALHEAITDQLSRDGRDEISRQVIDSPHFLVVFGVGLGLHLEELVRRSEARWLIIVEPFTDFLAQSFQTVDWAALCEGIEAKGGKIDIVTEIDPGKMASAIVRFMAAQGIPYVDGSYVFTHYPLWAFTEGRKRLYGAVEFAFINRGFFEDELCMMGNAVENFAAGPFWLLEGRPRLQRPETAVIVGAGPSLDETIPMLKEIRDRIVLFSAGTALRPLLRNGLVPDFHCELENVPAVCDALQGAAQYGDLSQITLLASATVHPKVPPLFREAIYFFRDSVSSTRILGAKHLPINGAAPTCVNTAVSMAAFLGFTDMILLGADCGIKPGGEDHASDTVYRDVGLFKKDGDRNERFPMEVEGNFGGIARTDWIYNSCRLMLAEVVQARGLTVANCSDGAFIPGTTPLVAEAIEIETPPIDRGGLLATLKRSLSRIDPADLFAETDLAGLAGHAEAMFADLDTLLQELRAGEPDFAAAYGKVMAFTAEAGERYRRAEAIVGGTLQALPRIAMFFGFRVAAGPLRRRLFDRFIDEFHATNERMRDETRRLFDRLAAAVASGGLAAAVASGEEREDGRRLVGRPGG